MRTEPMSEMKIRLRLLCIALCVSAAASVYAEEPEPATLTPETPVRLQTDWVEGGGWRNGLVAGANPCTMILLSQPMAGGYNRIALMALNRLQVRDAAGKWEDVDLNALLAREPTGCHTEGAG